MHNLFPIHHLRLRALRVNIFVMSKPNMYDEHTQTSQEADHSTYSKWQFIGSNFTKILHCRRKKKNIAYLYCAPRNTTNRDDSTLSDLQLFCS